MDNVCNVKRFRTFISFDGGINYSAIKLIEDPKIKLALQKESYIYRIESDEWKFTRYENIGIYDILIAYLSDVNLITSEIRLKVDLYDDFSVLEENIFTGYIPINGIQINEDTGFIKVKPKPIDNYNWWDKYSDFNFEVFRFAESGALTDFELWIADNSFVYHILSYHWIDLNDIIDYILAGIGGRIDAATNKSGTALTYSSAFFKTNPNIINDRDLTKVAIAPMKEIIDRWTALLEGTTPPASTVYEYGDINLKDICDSLHTMFNVYVAIIGNSFVIEHQDYFEQGLSYFVPLAVLTDFTNTTDYPLKMQVINDRLGNETDNDYEYLIEDRTPVRETFSYLNQIDYAPGEIRYVSSLCDKDEVKEHKVSIFSADVWRMQFAPDRYGTDKFAICVHETYLGAERVAERDAYSMPPGYFQNTGLNVNFPGGDLMWDNLLNDFWTYYRYFTSGYINNVNDPSLQVPGPPPVFPCFELQTFTQKNIIRQREIDAPFIYPGIPFEQWVYRYLKTNMSEICKLDVVEIDTNTGILTYKLIHK